jgi:hypothetical protein
MNKRIDLTNLGGFPFEQDTLKFMQESYDAAFQGVAALCGNKTILSGVVCDGRNVSSGWISYNGELIPFIGAALADNVVITETSDAKIFEDGSQHNVYFTKVATCGNVGDFPFSDLVPLLSLQNIWRPGNIKEHYCDDAYIAANFDANGFGINAEKGWRILSKAIPDAAGKTFVNIDFADAEFNQVGKIGGEKEHKILKAELPNIRLNVSIPTTATSQGETGSGKITTGGEANDIAVGPTLQTDLLGSGNAMPIMNPYFVILKLIKL